MTAWFCVVNKALTTFGWWVQIRNGYFIDTNTNIYTLIDITKINYLKIHYNPLH